MYMLAQYICTYMLAEYSMYMLAEYLCTYTLAESVHTEMVYH